MLPPPRPVHDGAFNGAINAHTVPLRAAFSAGPFRVAQIDDAVARPARAELFRYLGPAGGVSLFDCSEAALSPWAVRHAEVLRLRAGALAGRDAVVVGVRGGLLSWDVNNAGVATPASGCPRREQLDELCDPVVVGTADLPEFVG